MKKQRPKICRCCGFWITKGQADHNPTCQVAEWEVIAKKQEETAKKQKEIQQRIKQKMVEEYYRKKRIGPPIPVNSTSKAKPHPHSNWPPIINGGAVESNKRRH
jgi:hypothetical protein